MVFSTLSFLFFFFPILFVLYFASKNRVWRNTVLLVASLVFYGWGEPKYIFLMLLASLVAYAGGLFIDLFDRQGRNGCKRAAFVITVVLLTANLFIFKYLNFAVENLNRVLGNSIRIRQILLPIGISFYTFQILSYVIDLYRRKIALQKNYFYLTLYLTFFPQLIAGPIVRYQTVEEEILQRRETLDDVVYGFRRFAVGLAKKVIIANNTGAIATLIYEGGTQVYGTGMYWLAAVAYALQIYFDFSGYSDMAIGLGRMFGFHFLENFNYPYISRSVTEFWRRWHISLSTWFRDYIYIPLGGNRVKKSRWIINICVVWGLTGFWHGAEWNFLLWGLYYACLLLIEKLFLQRFIEKLPKALSWLYTMVLVLIGWVLFNMGSFVQVCETISRMFVFHANDLQTVVAANTDIAYALLYIPLGVICMLPWVKKISLPQNTVTEIVLNAVSLVLLGVSVVYIFGSTYNPFIYFRF